MVRTPLVCGHGQIENRGSSPTVREGSQSLAFEPSLMVGLLPRGEQKMRTGNCRRCARGERSRISRLTQQLRI